MSRSFQMINPTIEGTFTSTCDARKPLQAAKKIWSSLAEHVMSHVPRFMFTLREMSTQDLHHFEVNEKSEGKYTIKRIDMKIPNKKFEDFEHMIDQYSQARDIHLQGGKHKRALLNDDSSSSSSSSSSDAYPTLKHTSPIAMFHYNTHVYYTNDDYTYKPISNPRLIGVDIPVVTNVLTPIPIMAPIMTPFITPIFTPIFKPSLRTFVSIWP